jgi:type III secretory pathway component EscS
VATPGDVNLSGTQTVIIALVSLGSLIVAALVGINVAIVRAGRGDC